MDQQSDPIDPRLGDVNLDDAPGLTSRDETALDVIRRQLAEEYGDVGLPALVSREDVDIVPDAAVKPVRGSRTRRWPLVIGLLALAAVGGGTVGSILTVHMLGKPDVMLASGVPPEALREPAAAPPQEGANAVTSEPPQVHAGTQPASVTPAPRPTRPPELPAPTARPALPAPPARDALPEPPARGAAPTETRATSRAENGQRTATVPRDLSARETTAGSLVPRGNSPTRWLPPPAASPPTTPSSATRAPMGSPPIAGPEPQGWSDPFQPLSDEAAAHAGVAKAAFRSSAVSRVPPPAPPPTGQPLPAPRGVADRPVATPGPATDGGANPPPAPSREEGLLTTIREDWKTVRRGFETAPDDFRDAWRSLTRDLKNFLER